MTSLGCFGMALSKWKCALALTCLLVLTLSPTEEILCSVSSMKPQSLRKVIQQGGLGGLEWRQLISPSVLPSWISLGQILGCVRCGCGHPSADGI